MDFAELLLVAAGVFCVAGAILDWDWFMESRKARLFVTIFGRNGARVFYGILGAAMSTVGILMAAGIIASSE